MLQIALCDDNTTIYPPWYIFWTNINHQSSGFELTSALDKGKQFDIYCLDIMMPGFTGIDLANEIRGSDKTAPIYFFYLIGWICIGKLFRKGRWLCIKACLERETLLTFDELLEQIEAQKKENTIIVRAATASKNISFKYSLCRGHWKKCVVSLDIRKSCGMHGAFSTVCNNLLK